MYFGQWTWTQGCLMLWIIRLSLKGPPKRNLLLWNTSIIVDGTNAQWFLMINQNVLNHDCAATGCTGGSLVEHHLSWHSCLRYNTSNRGVGQQPQLCLLKCYSMSLTLIQDLQCWGCKGATTSSCHFPPTLGSHHSTHLLLALQGVRALELGLATAESLHPPFPFVYPCRAGRNLVWTASSGG